MKFRMLSKEEMELFDQDFKYFLIANGVKNEEWLEMNKTDLNKAEKLVELFSDSVLEIVYQRIEFLEFRDKNTCVVFKFNEDRIQLISLTSIGSDIDLSTPETIHEALQKKPDYLRIFKTEKVYSSNRELEIHKMISDGCVNSSKDFWEALDQLMA